MGIEKRGFASMTPERRREIARQGGQAAQAKGVAHQWTSAEAAVAGRKGGLVAAPRRREAAATRVKPPRAKRPVEDLVIEDIIWP